jgi:starvation-inducible DNA-binding protein
VAGPTIYQMHLLLDKHAGEISTTIDLIAERIQTSGGVYVCWPHFLSLRSIGDKIVRRKEDTYLGYL